jgi:hypothetical protein
MIDEASEFVVYTNDGYVAAIDAGKVTYTEDKSRAQSFHGAEWVRAWGSVRGAVLVFGPPCPRHAGQGGLIRERAALPW